MTHAQSQRANADAPYPVQTTPQVTPWVGMVVFAGTMLMLVGGFQIFQGLLALIRDDFYVVGRNGLLLQLDYTAWGWIHLIIGIIAIVTSIGILAGQMWARVIGIVIAGLSALANLAFLAAYPIWSTIVIAVDVLAIYALAVHGREARY